MLKSLRAVLGTPTGKDSGLIVLRAFTLNDEVVKKLNEQRKTGEAVPEHQKSRIRWKTPEETAARYLRGTLLSASLAIIGLSGAAVGINLFLATTLIASTAIFAGIIGAAGALVIGGIALAIYAGAKYLKADRQAQRKAAWRNGDPLLVLYRRVMASENPPPAQGKLNLLDVKAFSEISKATFDYMVRKAKENNEDKLLEFFSQFEGMQSSSSKGYTYATMGLGITSIATFGVGAYFLATVAAVTVLSVTLFAVGAVLALATLGCAALAANRRARSIAPPPKAKGVSVEAEPLGKEDTGPSLDDLSGTNLKLSGTKRTHRASEPGPQNHPGAEHKPRGGTYPGKLS